MNYKINILITTFLRDNLLYKTLQSIVDNYNNCCKVLIADQGYSDSEKDITIDYYKSQISLEYYKLPFDCGLSYARNFLVQKASEMNIPYCLVFADSLQFLQPYNFQPVIDFLEEDKQRGLVGFLDEGRKCPWEYNMEITPTGIKFTESTEIIESNSFIVLNKEDEDSVANRIKYLKVDICNNLFLAKTNTLVDLWDNELKLGEHEDALLTYKKRGYEVYWTDSYVFKKYNGRNNEEYEDYRKRLQDYLKIFKQKYNMSGWVIYPPKK